jgi:hypothetical protein
MARISSYPTAAAAAINDTLLGTDLSNSLATTNYSITSVLALLTASIAEYADNTAAIAAGLTVGNLYRTVDVLKVVH